MSDDESIESEDIVHHDSDDEPYNPFSQENDESVVNSLLFSNNDVYQGSHQLSNNKNLSISVESPSKIGDDANYSEEDFEYEDEEGQNAVSKAYSEDFEYDQSKNTFSKGYSEDFELDQSKSYSADFDLSQSTPIKPEKHSVQWHISTMKAAQTSSRSLVPIADMQSLQAELALQELGKEVIRLRNQQREVLRQRRIQTREKKLRAEERRKQYDSDLREALQTTNDLTKANIELNDQIKSYESQIQALEATKIILQSSLEQVENSLIDQRKQIENLSNSIDRLNSEKEQSEKVFIEKECVWKESETSFKEQISKKEFQLDIIRGSIEALEARSIKEHERLPAHYKNMLDERTARVVALEAELREKEGAMRVDEQRRLERLDALHREALQQTSQARERAVASVAEERSAICRLQASLGEERIQLMNQIEKQKLDLESSRLSLVQREVDLQRQDRDLARAVGELEAKQRLIEPHLRAAEDELEKARGEREQAKQVRAEAEDRLTSVLDADRGLRQRERDVQDAIARLALESGNIESQRNLLKSRVSRLQTDIMACKNERVGLHKVSLELARQMGLLRKSVSWLIRCNGRGSSSERLALDSVMAESGSVLENSPLIDENILDYSNDYAMWAGNSGRHYAVGTTPVTVPVPPYTKEPLSHSDRAALIRSLAELSRASITLQRVAAQLPPPTSTALSPTQDWDQFDESVADPTRAVSALDVSDMMASPHMNQYYANLASGSNAFTHSHSHPQSQPQIGNRRVLEDMSAVAGRTPWSQRSVDNSFGAHNQPTVISTHSLSYSASDASTRLDPQFSRKEQRVLTPSSLGYASLVASTPNNQLQSSDAGSDNGDFHVSIVEADKLRDSLRMAAMKYASFSSLQRPSL